MRLLWRRRSVPAARQGLYLRDRDRTVGHADARLAGRHELLRLNVDSGRGDHLGRDLTLGIGVWEPAHSVGTQAVSEGQQDLLARPMAVLPTPGGGKDVPASLVGRLEGR